jgi:hypothetical protein
MGKGQSESPADTTTGTRDDGYTRSFNNDDMIELLSTSIKKYVASTR